MNAAKSLIAALALSLVAGAGVAEDRMPPIPPEKMTEAQKKAAAEFQAARGVPVFGPFVPLLRSPELMNRAERMGDYLRYRSAIGNKLSELVILVTARQWTQHVEWAIHEPIALNAGIKADVVRAIAEGRLPAGMSEDEDIVYQFCVELHTNKSISDATYKRALDRFGEQGVMDILGIKGYYTFLAMVLNGARTPVADGKPAPLAPLPH
jgi:4-carboxymuconolactone decarboxylase